MLLPVYLIIYYDIFKRRSFGCLDSVDSAFLIKVEAVAKAQLLLHLTRKN